MVLQMSRPHKDKNTGIYYFRQKTPADLRQKYGKSEVGWLLRTKCKDEAKLRHAEALRKQALIWQSLRAEPGALPHKQIMALVGVSGRSQSTRAFARQSPQGA